MSQRDREAHAKLLGISVEEFDKLVLQANFAYNVIKNHGPFYGKEHIQEPTFRTTAQPVTLPKNEKEKMHDLGSDLFFFAKALSQLPQNIKEKLGEGIDFRIPPSWRIDSILTDKNILRVNEIEGKDGASALMIAEQIAYGLQSVSQSTAAKLTKILQIMCNPTNSKGVIQIALLHINILTNPLVPNTRRLIQAIEAFAQGTIRIELYDGEALRMGSDIPQWTGFDGIINESSLTLRELVALGIDENRVLSMGNFSAMANKGAYALLYNMNLETFWRQELGDKRFERLTTALIPSSFIENIEDLYNAHAKGKVVKVYWAGTNTTLVNKGQGVAMPEGQTEHSSKERWELMETLLRQGVKMIAQDYVRPAKVKALLRKKGISLEEVNWHNRVCIKYVCEQHPHTTKHPLVNLTGIEVTLGPDVIPAGRACAFTAGIFSQD